MAVGPAVVKWTWLLDNVEVQGVVVAEDPLDADGNIGGGDAFYIIPDPNYAHLASFASGSGGHINCETYRENVATHPVDPPLTPDRINRVVPWPLPTKPVGQVFTVSEPTHRTTRPLRPGDHVWLRGRWVIENGHPVNTHMRGLLNVGFVFVEFHPFDYTGIVLILPPTPSDTVTETVSVAAPIYEEVYPGSWFANRVAGVADHLFITASGGSGSGGTIHNMVIANAYIKAPTLPVPFMPHADLLNFTETVLLNGTGQLLEAIRTLEVVDDGIKVMVFASAPTTIPLDGMLIANINDPAQDKSVFQARYEVSWRPRLTAPSLVDAGQVVFGETRQFEVEVTNVGPEPVTVIGWQTTPYPSNGFPDNPFALTIQANGATTVVPGKSSVKLSATFTPQYAARYDGQLLIFCDDPVSAPLVHLEGIGGAILRR